VKRPINAALGWEMPSWLLDYGPVALIFLEGAATIATHRHGLGVPPGGGPSSAALWLSLLISCAALIRRHDAPLIVLGIVLFLVLLVNYAPTMTLPMLLAVFTVAEYRDRIRLATAAVITAVAVTGAEPLHGASQALPGIVSRLIAIGLAAALGLYLRARADYLEGLHERAERLERERQLLAREAVAEERVRIARELHDVVAHNVSLIVVEAQALAATGDSGAEQQAGLGRVAGLGREALSEMHRMLGVLRLQNGDAPERAPQPGVSDLEALVSRTREAGLDATLVVRGLPEELPPGVDLSAYRIVQEALTNVINHAHADHATVTLDYSGATLQVTVADDGIGSSAGPTNGASGGHGLVGMRERVALFGGELEAGSRTDGHGYRIHASLPVG
jgi:signal transduction histidine kinase